MRTRMITWTHLYLYLKLDLKFGESARIFRTVKISDEGLMYWTHEINDGGVNDADEDDAIVSIPYDVNVYMWILHRQCGDPPCQNMSLSRE